MRHQPATGKNPKSSRGVAGGRLSSADRRQAILESVMPVFAERGFAEVTTRTLADRAGISEALMFRHFPTKEALYKAVLEHFCDRQIDLRAVLQARPPSTATLVLMAWMIAVLVIDPPKRLGFSGLMPQLMLRSLLEDGLFIRTHWQGLGRPLFELMCASYRAAADSGDLTGDFAGEPVERILSLGQTSLLAFHLLALKANPLHSVGGGGRTGMVPAAVRFYLSGIGLKPAAIRRHSRPEVLDRELKPLLGWNGVVK